MAINETENDCRTLVPLPRVRHRLNLSRYRYNLCKLVLLAVDHTRGWRISRELSHNHKGAETRQQFQTSELPDLAFARIKL